MKVPTKRETDISFKKAFGISKNKLLDKRDAIFADSQLNIIPFWDQGGLAKSGEVFEIETKVSFTAGIIYKAPYAKGAEFGTGPHIVSFEELNPWVKRKFPNPLPDQKGTIEQRYTSLTWMIINKIKKFGTLPKAFLRSAIQKNMRR
jgi:hypothetical protein